MDDAYNSLLNDYYTEIWERYSSPIICFNGYSIQIENKMVYVLKDGKTIGWLWRAHDSGVYYCKLTDHDIRHAIRLTEAYAHICSTEEI